METYAKRFQDEDDLDAGESFEKLQAQFKPEDLGLRKAKLEEILQIYKKVLSKKESVFPEDKDNKKAASQ